MAASAIHLLRGGGAAGTSSGTGVGCCSQPMFMLVRVWRGEMLAADAGDAATAPARGRFLLPSRVLSRSSELLRPGIESPACGMSLHVSPAGSAFTRSRSSHGSGRSPNSLRMYVASDDCE